MAEIVPLRPLESWQAMDLAEQMSSDQDTQIRLAAEMMGMTEEEFLTLFCEEVAEDA